MFAEIHAAKDNRQDVNFIIILLHLFKIIQENAKS